MDSASGPAAGGSVSPSTMPQSRNWRYLGYRRGRRCLQPFQGIARPGVIYDSPAGGGGLMMDAQRHSGPDRGCCAINSGCPPWGRSRCPRLHRRRAFGDALETLAWRCWSRRPEDRRQRRIGRLLHRVQTAGGQDLGDLSSTDRVPLALRQQLGVSCLTAASSTAASTC